MRNVRIGAVSFLVDDEPHTIASNIERACNYIARAAEDGCDIVCLPEMFRTINVPDREYDAESIPGATSDVLAATAREQRINVLANWYVADSGAVYNQTTVFDRTGS